MKELLKWALTVQTQYSVSAAGILSLKQTSSENQLHRWRHLARLTELRLSAVIGWHTVVSGSALR